MATERKAGREWRVAGAAITGLLAVLPVCICLWALLPLPRPACPREAAGLRCASCGMTASIQEILSGRLEAGRAAHAGGIWFVALSIAGLALAPFSWRARAPLAVMLYPAVLIAAWGALSWHFFA